MHGFFSLSLFFFFSLPLPAPHSHECAVCYECTLTQSTTRANSGVGIITQKCETVSSESQESALIRWEAEETTPIL